jgi:peptidoglycan-binding protein ArfA
MPGSEHDRPGTDRRTATTLYRTKPGAGWLLVFLVVPALLALIGWAGLDRADRAGDMTLPSIDASATLTAAAPTPPGASIPDGGYPPWSITRNGNGLQLSGELPDEETKSSLLEVLRQVMPGVMIADQFTMKPGVTPPDAAALGGLFGAVIAMPDFDLKLKGDTVTLSGTAPSEAVKASAAEYSSSSWPNVKVINNIQVKG